MKKTFLLFFLFPFILFSQVQQISGVVYDQESGKPLPFVNITINRSNLGTAADIDGRFEIRSATLISTLTFSFVGYDKFTMPVTPSTPQPFEVYMKYSETQLSQVELVAGDNPAHRMIFNSIENRAKNNPERLSSFEYTSYNKFLFTLNTDSSLVPFDTVVHILDNGIEEVDIDSTNYFVQKFMDSQHLLLMESVSKRKYQLNPKKNNEKVLASRISGLKNPTFTLLATQLQSFSFYNDYITVLDQDYLNPISKGSTKKYQFILEDTTISVLDTTFIIAFTPKANPNFDALEGLLYITTDGWALKNILARPFKSESLRIEIQQKSKKFDDHWFPVQMNYDFSFPSIEVNGIEPVGIGRTYIDQIVLKEEYERKDFSRIEIKIADDATKKDEIYWDQYRVNPLDQKEINTYRVIDSLGKAQNFERKLKWAEALSSGKLRWKKFDFELDKILNYNIYEGLRLGLGGHTNEDLSQWISFGGFLGYGIKDETFKYGYDTRLLINKAHNIGLTVGYSFDIEETGAQKFSIQREAGIFNLNDIRELNIQQFDEVSNAYVGLSWDILPKLKSEVFFNRQNRFTTEFGYRYLEERDDGLYLVNGFTASQIGFSIQYAPNDTYMEGPFGRKPIKRTYPTFEFQYTKGLDGVLEGTYEYDKIDLRIKHSIKSRVFGISHFEVAGGFVNADVPYSFLYSPKTNRPFDVDWPILIADYLSFETMFNNEFISDRFAHFMFRQNFQSRFFSMGDWHPDLELTFKAGIGDLQNPEKHTGIDFKVMNLGYYETGIELNKMLQGLGVGAYYRFGPYQLQETKDNWSIKLSFRTSFF